jgi:hypothetical protein
MGENDFYSCNNALLVRSIRGLCRCRSLSHSFEYIRKRWNKGDLSDIMDQTDGLEVGLYYNCCGPH